MGDFQRCLLSPELKPHWQTFALEILPDSFSKVLSHVMGTFLIATNMVLTKQCMINVTAVRPDTQPVLCLAL